MLSSDSLRSELLRFQRISTATVYQFSSLREAELALDKFAQAFPMHSSSPQFPAALMHMWPSYATLLESQELAGLQLAFHQRRLMLCSAAAWYWLLEFCARRCQHIVGQLEDDPKCHDRSTDWLVRLCMAVRTSVKGRVAEDYQAGTFLAHLKGVDKPGRVQRPKVLEADCTSRICGNVIRLLRTWLDFPSNTEMLSAYFVMYLVGTSKNSDVLLLDG